MRIGIFSDIHANLEAMSAVMEAYASEGIDVYYCLGDVVGYGGSPNECSDLVRDIAEVNTVGKGRHADTALLFFSNHLGGVDGQLLCQEGDRQHQHHPDRY